MILSFIQTKGGTAKSTLARALAWSKSFRGAFKSIAVLELDPQGTLASWYQQRLENIGPIDNDIQVISIRETNREMLKSKIIELSGQHELLILDVPGESLGKFATKFAMALSDVVLIPMRSSDNDEQSFQDHIVPLIANIRASQDRAPQFHVIPTFVHPRTSSQRITDYFKEIMPSTVSCFQHHLPQRSVYENYSRDGLSLDEYAQMVKSNKREYEQVRRAQADIEGIAKEVLVIADSSVVKTSSSFIKTSKDRKKPKRSSSEGRKKNVHPS